MDFTEEAKTLGFSDAAVMDTDNLVFMPEYRVFCEENACGNYDKNPACPPESGTVEEMKARALKYEKTLVLQTTQDSLMDYKKAKLFHNKLTEKLSEKMNAMAEELGMKFFLRDAANVLQAECVVIIGTREQAQGLN